MVISSQRTREAVLRVPDALRLPITTGRYTVPKFAAALTAVAIAGCAPAYEHDVALKDGQPIYAATSDQAACGKIAGTPTLTATRIFNGVIQDLARDGFEPGTLTPHMQPGGTCPTDVMLWTRRSEGP